MIDALRALLGVGLPWIVGYGWLRALRPVGATNAYVEWGYGHFLGILILTLLMRLVGGFHAPLALRVLVPLLLGVAAAGIIVIRHVAKRHPGDAVAAAVPGDPLAIRGLAILVALLLLWRLGTLAIEVALRPLFPWDAWTQWATKARVWSQVHALVPFISMEAWLARTNGYVDSAPQYPTTVPLLQTWMALALGKFDDAMINLPWLAGFVAFGLAAYGQLRAMSISVTWSLFALYMVLSLPLLDTHVALAGYADFHVAAAFALALLALLAWETRRSAIQVLLFAPMVALLPLLKVPGLVWAATALLGWLVAAFGTSWKRVIGLATLTGAGAALGAVLLWRAKIEYVAGIAEGGVARALLENLFLFDNWHLLWFVLPLVVALAWRDAAARMRGTSTSLACGVLFLLAIFAGTRAGTWAADYTTINRAVLHLAPAAALFCAVLLWSWALRRDRLEPQAMASPAAQSPTYD